MAHGRLNAYVKGALGHPVPHGAAGPAKGVVRPPVKGVIRPPNPAVAAVPGAAPSSNPLPWDANYENTVGSINRNRDTTLAGLDQQEQSVKQQYGFDDLSDPFSRIALLKQSFANAQRGNTNSLAAQGQLYAGALQNAQAASQHGYDVNYDSTRRSYDQLLNDIASRRQRAKDTAVDQSAAADYDRIQAGLANRTDPDTLPAVAPPSSLPAMGTPNRHGQAKPRKPRKK